MEKPPQIAGTVFVDSHGERTLRARGATLSLRNIIGCAGAFAAGDWVYVVLRGTDGGQRAVARARVRCGADVIERTVLARIAAVDSNSSAAEPEIVVLAADDLVRLWAA